MKTKLLLSLSHNDHLVWTATQEIDSSLARLMTQEQLETLAIASEEILRRALRNEFSETDRPLQEKNTPKQKTRR